MRVSTEANLGAYVSFMGMGPSTGNVGGLAGVYTTPSVRGGRRPLQQSQSNLAIPRRRATEASYVMERMIHLAAENLR